MPRTTVNGAELHYEDEGQGRPLLFIHGVWMSGRLFEPQRPFFRERYRSIVLDLRGHGRSEHIHQGHTVAQYARDVRSTLESLELTDAVLVGWSMGSFVIWDYVRQFGTDRLAGVVIVDQSASDYGWPDWPYGFLDFDELCHVMAAVQTDRAALLDEFIPLLFKDDPGEHGDWIREAAGGIPPTIASSIIFDQTVQDFRSVLASVDVPALVCFGRDEKLVPVAAGEHLAASMPHARLVVFEESGHCPFVEESDRFNETVDEFVRSLG